MFKTLSGLTNNAFCVYLLIRKRAVLRYIWRLRAVLFAFWQTYVYFNIFSNKSQVKSTTDYHGFLEV